MKKLLTIALAAALATSALAMSASAADTTTYKTTDKITVEYTDVEKGWIAIYAGATPFDEYGSGSESGESRQYAYVEGSGKVEFNVPSAENAVVSGQDTGDATKVYYNEPDTPKALTEGDYHIVLFKGTGYDVVKQMGVFKVSDAATEPNPDDSKPEDPPKTGDARCGRLCGGCGRPGGHGPVRHQEEACQVNKKLKSSGSHWLPLLCCKRPLSRGGGFEKL